MKKAFLLFMALSTFVLSAQNIDPNKKRDKEKPEIHFTPEQRAELRSKQMTLELDLNDSQQAKVKQLFLEKEKSRSKISEKRSEMTADEAFAFRNERYDRRLEIKRGLKEILTEEQFQKLDRTKFRKSSTYRNRREGMMKTRH